MRMVYIALSVALGFALGCTYRELMGSRRSAPRPAPGKRREEDAEVGAGTGKTEPVETGAGGSFDLSRISDLFEEYKIDKKDIGAFPRLLKFIWQQSYLDLLRLFVEQGASPDAFARILRDMNTPCPEITFSAGSGQAFVTEESLNALIAEAGVACETLPGTDDKVRFLLMLSYGKGVRMFRDEFGEDFEAFLEAYEQGREVSGLHAELMDGLRARYEFVS